MNGQYLFLPVFTTDPYTQYTVLQETDYYYLRHVRGKPDGEFAGVCRVLIWDCRNFVRSSWGSVEGWLEDCHKNGHAAAIQVGKYDTEYAAEYWATLNNKGVDDGSE